MSVVRPEFGPTLPELLGPRVRALPRAAQVALAVLAVLAVVGLAVLVRRGTEDTRAHAGVRRPIAYNLVYPPALQRVRARGGETLRLQTPPGTAAPQSFAVRTLRLPAYHGDSTGILTLMSANLITRMRA